MITMIHDGLPVWRRAESYHDHVAVIDCGGTYTYARLLEASARIATGLCGNRRHGLEEARVALMAPPGFESAALLWGIWRAGGIAVPLCPEHPEPELEYVVCDAGVEAISASNQFAPLLFPLAAAAKARVRTTDDLVAGRGGTLPKVAAGGRAMILYTSGTTSKPKGVVSTHQNIAAQVCSLVDSWEWTESDHVLGVLPLHHIHGLVNVLCCALWVGAVWEALPKFDARQAIDRIMLGGITVFMAVPTIYTKLIAAWHETPVADQARFSQACARMRLMVSGSAALPVKTFEDWKSITGHTLLERYGMTEIGMALSNPLRGERKPGFVGRPLPGVEVMLADEEGHVIAGDRVQGEICVRGATLFREYWGRPEATSNAFRNGWFRTGDIGVREHGDYRIMGRNSVDIIKSGGYRVSAIEVESVLLEHPAIHECAVVGLDDAEWGECVSVAAVLKPAASITLPELREWAAHRLAKYKIPKRLQVVDALPRNAMSKITKPDVKRLFAAR